MPCWGLYVQKLTCPVRVVCHVLLGFICTEAYLSCQGGLSRHVGVYMDQKLTCSVRVVCHVLLGFICTEAYLSCQGGLSRLDGVYMYRSLPVLSGWSVMPCWVLYVQKLTCPVRVVCHVLMGFICTRSLPVLSGWSVTSCWGLYVPEAYLSCQGGLSRPVGVYMYQKLTCPVRAVCNVLLRFICIRNLLALIH